MSTVYLIQTPRAKIRTTPINLEPARNYGTIVPILSEDVNASKNVSRVLIELEQSLRRFDYRVDYIMWAIGDPLNLLMSGVVLSRLSIPYFMWLRYTKRGEIFYSPQKVPLYASPLPASPEPVAVLV